MEEKMSSSDQPIADHPICYAARSYPKIVRKFLEFDSSLAEEKNQYGQNLLHLIDNPFLWKEIYEGHPQLLMEKDKNGEYPIHSCFYKNFSSEFIQWILEQEMSQLYLRESYRKQLPIHLATQQSDNSSSSPLSPFQTTSLAEWMVSHDPKLLREKDEVGNTPLAIAIQCGNISLAKTWIEKNSELLFDENKEGLLPHHHSYLNEQGTEFIISLFSKFPELTSTKGYGGFFAIHSAAESGNLELVEWLLANAPKEALASNPQPA